MSSCYIPTPNEVNPLDQRTDCCTIPTAHAIQASTIQMIDCPICKTRGKAVDTQTLKAMLAVSLETLGASTYRFCRSEQCPVVYFSLDGQKIFREADIRERVYQKHPTDDDIFVCYCFRHTPATIRIEWLETGVSTVVERINGDIKAGLCACDIRNPQGDCCLGNVTQRVKQIQQAPN